MASITYNPRLHRGPTWMIGKSWAIRAEITHRWHHITKISRTLKDHRHKSSITGSVDETVHVHGGPINASFTPSHTPIQAAWPSTLAKMGLAPNGDPRDGGSLGGYTTSMALTLRTSQRSFAGNLYWKPYTNRPNLHTVTKAVFQATDVVTSLQRG